MSDFVQGNEREKKVKNSENMQTPQRKSVLTRSEVWAGVIDRGQSSFQIDLWQYF